MDLPHVGDRIELLEMPDDPAPIEPGTTGKVTRVNKTSYFNSTQISVDWDVERHLCLVVPPDRFRIIERAMD